MGTRVDLKAKFVKTGTDEPVKVKKFYFTFYDLDKPDGASAERVYVNGYDVYYLSANTEVKYADSALGTVFSSSRIRNSGDDPTSPEQLSDAQADRAVTLVF